MAVLRRVVGLWCCLAAAAAAAGVVDALPLEAVEGGLAAGDECREGVDGEQCALSALQLHSARKAQATVAKPTTAKPPAAAGATCDGFPYDPASEGCCGGSAAYLLKTQGCCNDKSVYSLSDATACLPAGVAPPGAAPAPPGAAPPAPAPDAPEAEPGSAPPEEMTFNCTANWPTEKAKKGWMSYCAETAKGAHRAWAMTPDCKAAWYVLDGKNADFAELEAIDKCTQKAKEQCGIFDRGGKLCSVFKPDAQCGDEIYHPGKQGCCDRSAFDLDAQACCGGIQVYDKGDEGCCAGVVYSSSEQGCCNRKDIYDKSTQDCCVKQGNAKVCARKGGPNHVSDSRLANINKDG